MVAGNAVEFFHLANEVEPFLRLSRPCLWQRGTGLPRWAMASPLRRFRLPRYRGYPARPATFGWGPVDPPSPLRSSRSCISAEGRRAHQMLHCAPYHLRIRKFEPISLASN